MSEYIYFTQEQLQFVFDTYKAIYKDIEYDKLSEERKKIYNEIKKELEGEEE